MSSLSLWKIPGHCLSQWQSGDCPIKTRETWEDSTLEVWRGERAGLYWREVSPSPPSWGTVSTPLYYSLHSLHILHTDCLLGVSWNVHPSGSAFHETWRAENWTALFHMIFLELYNILFNILLQINILSSTTFCSELIRKYTNLFIANLLWWSFLQIILNFQVIQCWSNKRYLERL